jgi:hypothetical protein
MFGLMFNGTVIARQSNSKLTIRREHEADKASPISISTANGGQPKAVAKSTRVLSGAA